jgi:hypothetical protein
MKARTKKLLVAAEAGLMNGDAYGALERVGEMPLRLELTSDMADSWQHDDHRDIRCLYLCFAAAMNETGDLWL